MHQLLILLSGILVLAVIGIYRESAWLNKGDATLYFLDIKERPHFKHDDMTPEAYEVSFG